ncbi:tryptorubin family RiPP precursor [Kitasatospora sp. NPDC001574]
MNHPVRRPSKGFSMKLVHFVRKAMPEKSLKAYAWYRWI